MAPDKRSDIYNMHASRDSVHTVRIFLYHVYCLARMYLYIYLYINISTFPRGFKPVFLLYLNSLDLNQAYVSRSCFHASTMCV